MARLAGAARRGLSPAQMKSATSLARDGAITRPDFGLGARTGAVLPGTGPPPASPALQARTSGPTMNADAMGVNAFHATPVGNPPAARTVGGRVQQTAQQGYGNRAISASPGAAAIRGVVAETAGRFRAGAPVLVSTGFGKAPRPSGLANAPTSPGPVGARFVAGRPAGFGPAGRFR